MRSIEERSRATCVGTGLVFDSKMLRGLLTAIFWVNIVPEGPRSRVTKHGGCPVAVGSKWITNKWISSNDQFDVYPCPLEKGAEHYGLFEKWRTWQKSDATLNARKY